MARIALIAPGRGSYTARELGYLNRFQGHPRFHLRKRMVEQADDHRRSIGRPALSELDGSAKFQASKHTAGEHASALIFTCSAADAALISPQHKIVAVLGNSMGWYSALQLSGILSFDQALRLADGMGGYHGGKNLGGQAIYPLVDSQWRERNGESERLLELAQEIRSQGRDHWVGLSIRLGGYLVFAGTPLGLDQLMKRLDKRRLGGQEYPLLLPGHAAFHSPLVEEASEWGRSHLSDLDWRQPNVPAIDGRGRVWRRFQSHPQELFEYTLRDQVVAPFDFSLSLRVTLREFSPDHLVLLGPGESLGGAIAQALIAEGWRGIRSKSRFKEEQAGANPILVSMNRPDQASKVI